MLRRIVTATAVLCALCAGGLWLGAKAVLADFFDPDSANLTTSSVPDCVQGHGGYGQADCEYGTISLTVKHNGAYWTDWLVKASDGNDPDVYAMWFESLGDDDAYPFGFNGSQSPVTIDFYVQTTSGSATILVNLKHDDDDNDQWDAADEDFDYFTLSVS